MNRRDFLRRMGAGAALPVLQNREACAQERPDRMNVLFIMTDQQFAEGMSCRMGRKYIHTPGMDRLATEGLLFERAYAPNPLCKPARTSIFTGHYPHETGVQTNNVSGRDYRNFPCLGTYFAEAGYDTAYFGKWHMPIDFDNAQESGFQRVDEKSSRCSTKKMEAFLEGKREKPFMAVASFINPHDICEWSRFEHMDSGGLDTIPPVSERPPLLPNHAPPENETDIMAFMRRSYQAHRLFPVGNYTEDDWRRLSWGYYRLIERVDAHVVRILETLEKTGLDKNTVVIFTSDHGDCHGAHRWNQKTVFYDESARVPLIIRYPGQPTRGQTCPYLVNNGVDLGPTMLDFAGIPIPEPMTGKSLRPIAEGKIERDDRDYVVVQNHLVQCEPIDGVHLEPEGRMVRSKRYKYCLYSEGKRRESLVDMDADPGETLNLAGDPEHQEALLKHRDYLTVFATQHGDKTAKAMLKSLEAG
jgi:arylsulfatase A-like enzyme